MIYGARYFFPSLVIACYKVGLGGRLCVLALPAQLLIFLFQCQY